MNEKDFYKGEIIKMIDGMNEYKFLESIYFFVKVMFEKDCQTK